MSSDGRRVALLCCDPGIGWGGTKGASVHLAETATALAATGASVWVVAARIDDPAAPAGVSIVQLPGPGRGAGARQRLAAERARADWLIRLLSDLDIEVLYERFSLHTRAGSLAAAEVGIPHLVELNAPLPAEAAAYRHLDEPAAAHRLEQAVLSDAGCVFAVSRPVADYAIQRRAPRVVVLPNAVDPARFPQADVGAHPVTAVFTGTLRPWHGIDVLAEAWRLLGREAPRLVVVGDGPGREELGSVAAEITGLVAHAAVPQQLARCQIGLAPYPAGGAGYFSPLKLFEYLATGLAVVAADLPGVTDIVDERTGVVVPAGDAPALAAAVARLAADPLERSRLGRAGRSLVRRDHTWARRADTILAVAGQLAAQRHTAGLPS